jgi:superfamily II DNA or RNA helicase
LLRELPSGDNWQAMSRRSLGRVQAHFLICEDPQRRMDAREVETLAHQVSLVRHVLDSEHLSRVLIADEVGLGKTVEVGLLVKELMEQRPGLRVLYLAPARLVANVRREFDRLGLPFRQWSAVDADARLDDPRIIASIHRAVHGKHFDQIVKTAPWDVLIVDECHHLSAWSPGGGDPVEAYRLVRDLIRRQPGDGRAVLLSGTPHQGHVQRFDNLLSLLRRDSESASALSGRVIYRTKEDVQDWQGNPLFPPRQVNEPIVVDLGPRYRAWVEHIHDFYVPPKNMGAALDRRHRAAGWRCAQALQWAASSPQAGLGYLVRQAVRAGWDLTHETLKQAVAGLRPYRAGQPNEQVEALFARIQKEVARQQQDADVDDIEDNEMFEAAPKVPTDGLDDLLDEGLALLRDSGDEKWQIIKQRLLDPAGDEKAVLFAQPIETVTALARFLERETGERPAIIIGGQSDQERTAVVDSFRSSDGPRYLVSSRAGGEGINLQVARRLVHIDVPWNPMELEQRVGRIHRFGSRKTILVDTVVVKDSREADAYRIAREKLRLIASTLVERDRFEAVFARVMCLVPPEELQQVLIQDAGPPFAPEDHAELGRMVQAGFQTWRAFHERFGEEQRRIKEQDPGLVAWEDLIRFAREQTGAKPVGGFATQRFSRESDGVHPVEAPARVLVLEDGRHYACGEEADGVPVFGPDGQIPYRLGLNSPPIADALRRLAFPNAAAGAAHLRWRPGLPLPDGATAELFGVLVYLRQTVRPDHVSGWAEQSNSLVCFIVSAAAPPLEVDGVAKGQLLRGLFVATVRAKPERDGALIPALAEAEVALRTTLWRPTSNEMAKNVRHAVMPLFAATVSLNTSD